MENMESKQNWSVSLAGFVIPVCMLYYEILLKILSKTPFSFVNMILSVFSSVGVGFLFYLLSSLSRSERANAWIAFALAEISCIVFATSYFIRNSFFAYQNIRAVLNTAGDIAGGFAGTVLRLILHGIPVILLFHVPILLFVFFVLIRKKICFSPLDLHEGIRTALMAAIALVCALLVLILDQRDNRVLTTHYNYDSAVSTYSLQAANIVDIAWLAFGNPYAGSYLIPDETTESTPEATTEEEQTEEDTTETTTEEVIVYEKNMLDIDWDALTEGETNNTLLSMHQYVQSLEPSSQNEFTGLFRGKNLVFITAEAFSKEAVRADVTPTLYRLATKGIVFEEYYQPDFHGSTAGGEFLNLIGLLSPHGVDNYYDTIGNALPFTIGNQLRSLGYFSRAYHNGSFDYYSRNWTHENFGYEKFIAYGNGLEDKIGNLTWPESDQEMIEATLGDYIDQDKFSVYYMSISAHGRYGPGNNAMSMENHDAVADLDASEFVKNYLAANIELDKALESLIRELEKRGIADDTVIVISPDHYPYCLEQSETWGTDRDYLSELYGFVPQNEFERHHNQLIIWSGDLEKAALGEETGNPVLDEKGSIVVSDPVYSVDILPTLSNLFGVAFDSRLMAGRDVLAEDTQPLCIWPDYSWITEKGFYFAPYRTFTARDGVQMSEEEVSAYVERISSIVYNRMTFSENVLDYDYYRIIEGALR